MDVTSSLARIARRLNIVYENSGDRLLRSLAAGYDAMKSACNRLSILVTTDLADYNKVISGSITGVMGVGLGVRDPDLMVNGSFESGTSYWTIYGDGDHSVTTEDKLCGSYSLRLGWKYSTIVEDGRDQAYQLVTIPDNAIDIEISFCYHLFTYDSQYHDWLEVYVAPQGGDPQQIFKTGGATFGGLEEFGWSQIRVDINQYAGQSVYIYFAVVNSQDTQYRTWCYLDYICLTYTETTPEQDDCLSTCLIGWCIDNAVLCEMCFSLFFACAVTGVSCVVFAYCVIAGGGSGAIYCIIFCTLM